MTIYGTEKDLGAMYQAKRIENDEVVYGLATIKVDDEKSYLIQLFETDDFTDGVPARAYYVAVRTDSITSLLKDEEDVCQNCGECKCFSCGYREGGHGGDCSGRCYNCEDEPLDNCTMFKSADW